MSGSEDFYLGSNFFLVKQDMAEGISSSDGELVGNSAVELVCCKAGYISCKRAIQKR